MASAFKSLKVQDVRELQELVAESVGAIEQGMRLLDTRVLLGGATIDLLAMDAEDRLTLVALGLGADDEMLLRALEGYSWCLEYPDALRRLYPSVQLSEHRPPRVIFISERAPDAFLRKVKHLRLERADCLEFRFGLQFSSVDELRGTDDGPQAPRPAPSASPERLAPAPAERHAPVSVERHAQAAVERHAHAAAERQAAAPVERPTPVPADRQPAVPVARAVAPTRHAPRPPRPESEGRAPVVPLRGPRPEPAATEPLAPARRESAEAARSAPTPPDTARPESRRDAAAEVAEVHAQMLEQLRSTTTTVGEWRDATAKIPAEVDDEKVRAVREYLQREFPTSVIYDFYAHDRGVQMFHLQDSHGALVHSAAVGEDLLDGASDAELGAFLDKHKLARVLRQAGSAGVSVTKSGLKIERR